jgi:hypothetical protein
MHDVCTIDNGLWSEMSSSASCSQPPSSQAMEGETSESVRGDTAKRPRLGRTKAKPSDSNIEMAKLTLLKQVHSTLSATNNDCLEMFGQQVANELRNVKDKALQLRLRRNIMMLHDHMLYDAQEAEQASQYQPPFVGAPSSQTRPFTSVPVQYQIYQAQQSPQSELDHQAQSQSLPAPLSFVRMLN